MTRGRTICHKVTVRVIQHLGLGDEVCLHVQNQPTKSIGVFAISDTTFKMIISSAFSISQIQNPDIDAICFLLAALNDQFVLKT